MRTLAAILGLLALAAAQEPPAAAIDGRWANPSGSVIIDIAPCGEARCGTVKWASAKAIADARKGTGQLIGSNLLTDLKERKPGQWQGRLFVPDKKVRVKAKITLESENQLKVSGCAIAICKAQLWSRSAEPLPGSD